jgi:hypothetical protein
MYIVLVEAAQMPTEKLAVLQMTEDLGKVVVMHRTSE